ncbi:hypothetical protein ACSTS3_16750 [Aquimarina muelleri]|uniref:hypothetical protein n=1 Tax=Aquimarina muelleri TaxID=279356 RepID=UPI003F683093
MNKNRFHFLLAVLVIISCKTKLKKDTLTTSSNDVIINQKIKSSNNKPAQIKSKELSFFENNSDYFVEDIDLNEDGIIDKIVSSSQYKGDELYLFIKKNGKYILKLETVNLSEDGGKIIGDILPLDSKDEVFKIHTFFPKGNLQAHHFISYDQGNWILKRTIYETSNWRKSDTVYLCEVKQNILLKDLKNNSGFKKFKHIPNEKYRDKVCKTKKQ